MRINAFRIGLVTLVAGCTAQSVEAPLARTDLRQAMAATQVDPVGVAIAPNGDRFVFDQARGLYRIDGNTSVEVVPMSALPVPAAGTRLQLPFTDLAVISPGVFALTAIGDGFLLDTTAMTLKQHFCYLPGGLPSDLVQRTDAIAYDPEHGRIYAQPITTDTNGNFQYAQLAAYDSTSGTDVEWYSADASVAATGMTMMPEVGLVLGQGSHLTRFDLSSKRTVELDDLERYGVHSIDGLAVDPVAKTLIVVDRSTSELVEIELAHLAL